MESPDAEQGSVAADPTTTTRTKAKRQRSEIAFPYDDLNAAIEIARFAYNKHGGQAEPDQIAADLGQNANSGAFRAKIGAARLFGLIGGKRGEIAVTPLGRRVLDDTTARAAQVDAFLEVPLYAALFDAFRGGVLPGDTGLEATIAQLGVPEKQVRTARQVFQRSAKQAGFFDAAPDRLVKPPLLGAGDTVTATDQDGSQDGTQGDSTEARQEDALTSKPAIVVEIFKRLPDEGKPFTASERSRWVAALNATLDLIYPEGPAEVTVRLKGGGADGQAET